MVLLCEWCIFSPPRVSRCMSCAQLVFPRMSCTLWCCLFSDYFIVWASCVSVLRLLRTGWWVDHEFCLVPAALCCLLHPARKTASHVSASLASHPFGVMPFRFLGYNQISIGSMSSDCGKPWWVEPMRTFLSYSCSVPALRLPLFVFLSSPPPVSPPPLLLQVQLIPPPLLISSPSLPPPRWRHRWIALVAASCASSTAVARSAFALPLFPLPSPFLLRPWGTVGSPSDEDGVPDFGGTTTLAP